MEDFESPEGFLDIKPSSDIELDCRLPIQELLKLQQIDSNVLDEIEIEAQHLTSSLDSLLENLYNLLNSVSSITADTIEVHKNVVSKLADSMDTNIKCMYTIMAKAEELSKTMGPAENIYMKVREIKRLVDRLDHIV